MITYRDRRLWAALARLSEHPDRDRTRTTIARQGGVWAVTVHFPRRSSVGRSV